MIKTLGNIYSTSQNEGLKNINTYVTLKKRRWKTANKVDRLILQGKNELSGAPASEGITVVMESSK